MIATARLRLQGWTEADRAPFHAMCNDPAVMEYLGAPLSLANVDAAIARQRDLQGELGYCFWAVERKEDGVFLGFCGLKPGAASTPIQGTIEIGWRFAVPYWSKGYAREAAEASLAWGWANLHADDIWAMTVAGNSRSWRLMERIGMARRAALDFDHPQPGLEDRLKPHIIYSIGRPV